MTEKNTVRQVITEVQKFVILKIEVRNQKCLLELLQLPGKNLATSLLGLVPLTRNEITNEINGDYSEDTIMMAMAKADEKNGSTRGM